MDAPRGRVALVLDRDATLHHHVAELLGRLGFTCVKAATAAEALERLGQTGLALVVADTELPDMSATSLLDRVRERDQQVPVIFLGRRRGGERLTRAAAEVVERDLDQLRRTVDALGSLGSHHHHHQAGARTGHEVADLEPGPDLEQLFGGSAAMRGVEAVVRRAATVDAPVLIEGETGVGKRLVALAIHRLSFRASEPWVRLSAASLPPELLEAELFGCDDGSTSKRGKLEVAGAGTLFLDDIDEVPLAFQAKLVRVLADKEFFRLGGRELLATDVRVVAAAQRPLAELVGLGSFREDLYDCLNIVRIQVPPLRERREEIARLVERFREAFTREYGRAAEPFSSETLELFLAYHWPGNVRELEGMVKRYVVLGDEKHLRSELESRLRALGPTQSGAGSPPPHAPSDIGLREIARRAARQAERVAIREVLERVQWNRAEASRLLKISYKTLLHRLDEEGFAKKPRVRRQGKAKAQNG